MARYLSLRHNRHTVSINECIKIRVRSLSTNNVIISGQSKWISWTKKTIPKSFYRSSSTPQLITSSSQNSGQNHHRQYATVNVIKEGTTTTTTTVTEQNKVEIEGQVGSKKLPIKILGSLMGVYDFLTYPIYTLIQNPKARLARHNAVKAIQSPDTPNEWVSVVPKCPVTENMERLGIDSLEKVFDYAMIKFANKKCLGTRPILSQIDVKDPTGQPMRQVELGDYEWKSYGEVNDLTTKIAQNMKTKLGLQSRGTIAIFADTREEWLMTAIAAFKANLAIVTVFTALGDDAVVYAINETEVNCLFTSEDLMPRCYNLFKKMPLVQKIVYMDKAGTTVEIDRDQIPPSMTVQPLSSLFEALKEEDDDEMTQAKMTQKPGPHDTAIIMYTSGSTGTPKGVILSHWNAICVIKGVADAVGRDRLPLPDSDERYLSFLPLAHILELIAEAMCILQGMAVAYGSPLTLTDMSPGLKKGTKGDATILRPTMMATVPLIIERVAKAVQANLKQRGGLLPDLFDHFVRYKNQWTRRGFETPVLDKLFFQKIRNLLGGQVKLIFCGGAMLSPETQEMVRSMLCLSLIIGYGLTETAGSVSACSGDDLTVGRSGGPIRGSRFRLVDWEEGGYRFSDKPYPRGELYVGGESVAMGYLKRSDNQDFFIESGIRWVKTGDIGEFHEDGCVQIIDRKKDLVKLSDGEFVSLGKIESILKISPLIDNICIYANSILPNTLAIVIPSRVEIANLAKIIGKSGGLTHEQLTQDADIVRRALEEIQNHGKASNLNKSEIPLQIYLTPNLWTPQNGLVTSSLKLKRVNIQNEFQSQIDEMSSKIRSS